MGQGSCEIRIGTSGWYYDHWRGRFYPEKLPKSRWLQHYAERFDTVEINNTFYHLPKEQTMIGWHDKTPESFLFALKASRYITHVKKLIDPEESLKRFLDLAGLLKSRLGPVLFQLPPSLQKDVPRLEAFTKSLPRGISAVFEFRHASWNDGEVFDLLDKRNMALCMHDMVGCASPRVVTGDCIYLRFHGPAGRYAGNYTKAMLVDWADWLAGQRRNVRAIYVYFNNDVEGYAINNAKTLKALLSSPLSRGL